MTTITEALKELRNNRLTEGKRKLKLKFKESVESSMPVEILPHDTIYNFVRDVPAGQFFHVGYIREITSSLASRYRGARGSVNKETGEVETNVRIFKCSEYYGCTGVNYENKQSTIDYRNETGKERVGNKGTFNMDELPLRIGITTSGDEQLQLFPRETSPIRVKYFISYNDSNLAEATKEEVAQYMTPAKASELLNGRGEKAASGATVVRLSLSKIYWIGTNGHSLF